MLKYIYIYVYIWLHRKEESKNISARKEEGKKKNYFGNGIAPEAERAS
jgi:hypothetical protein